MEFVIDKRVLVLGVLLVIVAGLLVPLTIAKRAKPVKQCDDHIDNDGDGYCDFAWQKAHCDDGSIVGDPGCEARNDDDETDPTTTTTTTTTTIPDSCSDTDGGFVPPVKGTVSGYKYGFPYSYPDFCEANSTTLLYEYYCVGNDYESQLYDCAVNYTSCSDGACV